MRHVFGPVPSRRLGRSLGLDVTPVKVCSLDCVYCQIRATDTKTLERREWVPEGEVLGECRAFFERGGEADAVTFAGSGEPTLHSGIGRMIRSIKAFTRTPVAVITNGTLLSDPAVRADLAAADLVMPNVDAGDEATFARINRPADGLTLARVLDGLRAFAAEYRGLLPLEVFLAPGYNSDRASLEAIAAAIRSLPRHDGIDLNASRRPPRAGEVRMPDEAEFALAEGILAAAGRVTSLRDPAPPRVAFRPIPFDDESFLAVVSRHPMNAAEVAAVFSLPPVAVEEAGRRLVAAGRLRVGAAGCYEAA